MHVTNVPQQAAPAVSAASTVMPATASRRSLLAMAAAGLGSLPALAVAAPIAAPDPDAELIKLCARFVELERRYIDLIKPAEDDEQAQNWSAAIEAEQRPLLDAICKLRSTVPSGIRALTEAVITADSQVVYRDGTDSNGDRLCHTLLLSLLGPDGIELEGDVLSSKWRSAVADENPIGASPRRESPFERDAELIQACRDLDTVVAQRAALYDYKAGSITDEAERVVGKAGDQLCDAYAEIRDRMEDMSCSTLKGLGTFARSILQADVGELRHKAVQCGDKEFVLIVKALEQAATYG